MTPKAFYRNYLADNSLGDINFKLEELIKATNPNSVFEFGCGTGKNLRSLDPIVTCGMDVSPQNVIVSHYRNMRSFVILGDEYNLGHLANFDVAFTCSVLDHIEDVDRIITELKRMAPIVFLAETNDQVAEHYFAHDYESQGFQKIENFKWIGHDKATYYIWKYAR